MKIRPIANALSCTRARRKTTKEQILLEEEHIQDSKGKVHGILNASSKICSLVVNGQSFLVTDGSLLILF